MGGKFGFVPKSYLQVYTGNPVKWQCVLDVLQAHKIIKNTGLPNFMCSRIPVKSDLNCVAWRTLLQDYCYQQISDLIEFGFPLDLIGIVP